MKIASWVAEGGEKTWGVTDGTRFAPAGSREDFHQELDSGRWRESAATAEAVLLREEGELVTADRLLAPAPLRRNVFCLGPNYLDHVTESLNSSEVPRQPLYFTKATTALAPPRHVLTVDPSITARMDWEIELAVVLARGGRDIPLERALEWVLGYAVAVDFSARDIQVGRPEGQWFLGKSLDGTFPLGPWLLTADEVEDPQALELTLKVDGEVKQHASTAQMLFSVATIIADLSRHLTLLPGDVISTGTPAGVGDALTPPEYLSPGQVVEAHIAGIGSLRTTIAAPREPHASRENDLHEH